MLKNCQNCYKSTNATINPFNRFNRASRSSLVSALRLRILNKKNICVHLCVSVGEAKGKSSEQFEQLELSVRTPITASTKRLYFCRTITKRAAFMPNKCISIKAAPSFHSASALFRAGPCLPNR